MPEVEIECSMCGRNGGPYAECPRGCGGRAEFVQTRAYTASEERSGRAPTDSRYGFDGAVGPKTDDPMWTQ
jgi:hypothetical protein